MCKKKWPGHSFWRSGEIHCQHCWEQVTSMQVLSKQYRHLPQPDTASLAHSQRVAEHIRRLIEDAGGSIGFAEFMQHALYASGLGYYSAGATKFGEAGDFITAPEVSPLFSRILANQVAVVLEQIDDPLDRVVLEFGAGSGALAVELLKRLESLAALPARYYILDVSADLRQRQAAAIQAAMPHYFDNVTWISALPESFAGAVIANEVLDALPVERFLKREQRIFRRSVACSGDAFIWLTETAPKVLERALLKIEANLGLVLPDGYESEISLGIGAWVSELAARLRQGFVFLFDYGVSQSEYYAEDRLNGWLRCHFRHHAHSDPLIYPGIQDLSAWVNFSQVATAAFDSGLQIAGFVTQAQFMLQGGLQQELHDIAGLPTAAQIEMSQQVKLLMMPGEMGESFKCLGLSKGDIDAPELFKLADRSHTL